LEKDQIKETEKNGKSLSAERQTEGGGKFEKQGEDDIRESDGKPVSGFYLASKE